MAKHTVLVVDDDPKIVMLVRLYLEQEGYGVLVARDGLEALDTARQEQPDLIVLDLLLPQVDGLDVCRLLRAESQVPIIMLTARSMEDDKILGLDLGADDYVTKPFSPRELMARVRARLRHVDETDRRPDELRFGRLVIDRRAHEVRLDGRVVDVTPTEFKLLYTLASEPDRAFSRAELLDLVFGFDFEGFDRTVDVHVMNLRKKIEPEPKHPIYIRTVYGVGYKFSQG
jgi:DNA-binding response OmpR family regulator